MLQALGAGVARGEGDVQLVLPLARAMALGAAARPAPPPRPAAAPVLPAPTPLAPTGRLPAQLAIPDGYAEDLGRDPPRFADPVDPDRVVAFDLLPRRRAGWQASVAYDEESRLPLRDPGEIVRFVVERRF
jgi:hypothetical protein